MTCCAACPEWRICTLAAAAAIIMQGVVASYAMSDRTACLRLWLSKAEAHSARLCARAWLAMSCFCSAQVRITVWAAMRSV